MIYTYTHTQTYPIKVFYFDREVVVTTIPVIVILFASYVQSTVHELLAYDEPMLCFFFFTITTPESQMKKPRLRNKKQKCNLLSKQLSLNLEVLVTFCGN